MRFKLAISLLFCFLSLHCLGQEKKLLIEGNELYQQKKYNEAAKAYEQANGKKPTAIGSFNLGNTYFRQFLAEDSAKKGTRQPAMPPSQQEEPNKTLEAARNAMNAAAKQANNKKEKAGANYNVGNTYMAEKKWQEAADAYKKALRANPQDADAKYNLSYALQMLKQQQQQNDKKKDQKNKDKQDQNKEQKDKEKKDKQDENKNDQQGKDKDKQDEQQKPQPQQSKLSQQQAEQMLNALQQEEKNLQEKKQKAKGIPVRMEKDW